MSPPSADPAQQLRQLLKLPGNRQCADCGNPGPTYVNVTIGTFVCTACSGRLRGLLSTHRVKSISVATFSQAEVDFVRKRGNEWSRSVWLATYDGTEYSDLDSRNNRQMERFINDKYEKKLYYREPGEQVSSSGCVHGSISGSSLVSDASAASSSLAPTRMSSDKLLMCGAVALPGLSAPRLSEDLNVLRDTRVGDVNSIADQPKPLPRLSSISAFPRINGPPVASPRATKLRSTGNLSLDPESGSRGEMMAPPTANGDSCFADFDTAFSSCPEPASGVLQPCSNPSLLGSEFSCSDSGGVVTLGAPGVAEASDKYGALKELDDTFRCQSSPQCLPTGSTNGSAPPGSTWGSSQGEQNWSSVSTVSSSSSNPVNGTALHHPGLANSSNQQQLWPSPQSQPQQLWPTSHSQPQQPWPTSQSQPQQLWPSPQSQPQQPWPSSQSQPQQLWPSPQSQPQQPWPTSQSQPQQPWPTPQSQPQQPWPSPQSQPQQSWPSPQSQPQQLWPSPQSQPQQPWPSPQSQPQQLWPSPQSQPQQPWPSPQSQPQPPWPSQQPQTLKPWPSPQSQPWSPSQGLLQPQQPWTQPNQQQPWSTTQTERQSSTQQQALSSQPKTESQFLQKQDIFSLQPSSDRLPQEFSWPSLAAPSTTASSNPFL